MSTLEHPPTTDDDILVDALEFDPACEVIITATGEACRQAAAWVVACLRCDDSRYSCEECRLISIEDAKRVLAKPNRAIACMRCRAVAYSLDELFVFIPIGRTE